MTDQGGLERLLTDEVAVNRDLLYEVLAPYVRIGKDTGVPIFTPSFARLSASSKIVVYLLYRKAAAALGIAGKADKATPKEISEATGVLYDTVKPTVSELAKKRILARESGTYYFPNGLLLNAREMIK